MHAKKLKIHFIGIGGIGVSALAKYYLEKGHKVTGSDLNASEITNALEKKGVKIFIGSHKKYLNLKFEQIPNLVVYSPAAQASNPELKKAKRLKIKTQSYPEALGELTKQHFTIAICGTHGKSTTTAMLGLLLKKAGLDPTVIVGTKVKEFNNSNCRTGKSKYLVIEACEHDESFLNYWPKIIILTNIEKEHLDYYKNLSNILKAFKKFISHLPENGCLVANQDDKNIRSMFRNSTSKHFKYFLYSLKNKGAEKIKKILKVPGEHNVYNALAALTAARILKIPDKTSFKALSEYQGSWRRFEEREFKIENCKLKIISDYAHHPTEIKTTLKAAREKFPEKEIWCVFQPHQYQRTFYLFKDFVKVFKEALQQVQGKLLLDKLIITDIYDVAGRGERKIKEKMNSKKLIKAIDNPWTLYLPKEKIIKYLKKNLHGGEAVIIMGAGDIYKLVDSFT